MEKITRTIESKKVTAVVTDTVALQTRTQDYVVPGSCKKILTAVNEQLGENEVAVCIKEVVTESHKYEMPLDQFVELATLAE